MTSDDESRRVSGSPGETAGVAAATADPGPQRSRRDAEREQRLAAALRENLKRRRAQARARSEVSASED